METKQIINWLRDKADRADNPSWTRMMHKAADRLKELDQGQADTASRTAEVCATMTDKEKLMRIFRNHNYPKLDGDPIENLADYLIDSGVTIPNKGHWIIHSSGKGASATIWAECSECHVCGSSQWKVCPVCETRMVKQR